MTKRNNDFWIRKTSGRCVYSGEPIGNRPAVLEKYALDYVKKQGYRLDSKLHFNFNYLKLLLVALFLLTFNFSIMGLVSSISTYNNSFISSSYLGTYFPYNYGIVNFSLWVKNDTYLMFDGNDYIKIPIRYDFNNRPWSLSVWYNFSDSVSGDYILGLSNETDINFIGITAYGSGTRNVTLNLNNKTNSARGQESNLNNATGWRYVALIYDGSGIWICGNNLSCNYMSGVNISYQFSNFTDFSLGRIRLGGYSVSLNGTADLFRVYGTNLDTTAITEQYNRDERGGNLGTGLTIFYAHKVGEANGSYNIEINNFTNYMNIFENLSMKSITFSQYLDWRNHSYTMDSINPVILMFDDGFKSVYTNASSIFASKGFVGNIAVTSSLIGTSGYMSWDDLRILSSQGWDIGCHGYSHSNITGLTYEARQAQFQQCKDDVTEEIGIKPRFWVYPYNSHNDVIDSECLMYYELCTGNASSSKYIYKNSSLYNPNSIYRNELLDGLLNSTIVKYASAYPFLVYNYDINEGMDSTLFDKAGSYNSSITGASWRSSEDNDYLTFDLEYFLTVNLIELVESNYFFRRIFFSYQDCSESQYNYTEVIQLIPWSNLSTTCSNGYIKQQRTMQNYSFCTSSNFTYIETSYNRCQDPLWTLDLTSYLTGAILIVFLVIVVLLCYYGYFSFAGGISIILGLSLAISGLAGIICILIIAIGCVLLFFGRK